MRGFWTVYRLGVKEVFSLLRDPVLMGLILYTFTVAIYTVANSVQTEVRNAAIAVVDEDRSALSGRIAAAFLAPQFKPPAALTLDAVDAAMDAGTYSFVLDIPPRFEADLLAGRAPAIQLNVDATAMTLAGNGARYIGAIVEAETAAFLAQGGGRAGGEGVRVAIRAKYNPNLEGGWFMAMNQLVNNLTILAMILGGAAVIREREHGTIEHLLVMPVTAAQIMLAKIWANGLVIVLAASLSLRLVAGGLIGVPVAGPPGLFAFGAAIYVFAVISMGVMLSTVATTMPQFGLLSIPVFVVMNLLSGGITPIESMPPALQVAVQALPSTHFVAFSQSVLFRDAGPGVVWPQLAAMAGLGALFFALALRRFRAALSAAQ